MGIEVLAAFLATLIQLTTRSVCSAFQSGAPSCREPLIKLSEAKQQVDTTFDWAKQWYPVAPAQDLDKYGPNKITLLGMDLAVWYHSPSSSWRAFRDVCPHRLVPLSEGRVEPSRGILQCAYHGWEFDADGSCARIPQLSEIDGGPSSAAVMNPRACATAFPTRTEQGLVWVFPTADEQAAEAAKAPALIPELDDADKIDATDFFFRDMPYGWDILVENLCDPSHIPFAHHEMMRGADRNDVDAVEMEIVDESDDGFVARKNPYPAGRGRYDVRFEAPCLLYYEIVDPQAKSYIGLGTYCIPTAPGRCRILARFPFRLSFKPAMAIVRRTPRWITHLSQNVVMDSDVVFLSSQDELLDGNRGRGGEYTSTPNYYMPAKCDAMVTSFRNWVGRKGGGGPTWLGTPAERSDGEPTGWLRPTAVPQRGGRDALLDRYRQHTDSCTSCRKAHRTLHILREVCIGSGICLLAGAAAGVSPAGTSAGKKLLASTGAALILAPRILIRPLISRLECAPWPRKKWRQPTDVATELEELPDPTDMIRPVPQGE